MARILFAYETRVGLIVAVYMSLFLHPSAGAMQSNPADDLACQGNLLRACNIPGEVVRFSVRSGRNNTQSGLDPLWEINGAPAFTSATSASAPYRGWEANGQATWIGPEAQGEAQGNVRVPAGPYTYSARIWLEQHPDLYGRIRMSLTIAGDNEVASVSINGVQVHVGNGGNKDFQAGNFENVRFSDPTNAPWTRGCNEIQVTIVNHGASGNPTITGVSILGNVRARCPDCETIPTDESSTDNDGSHG